MYVVTINVQPVNVANPEVKYRKIKMQGIYIPKGKSTRKGKIQAAIDEWAKYRLAGMLNVEYKATVVSVKAVDYNFYISEFTDDEIKTITMNNNETTKE